MGEDGEATRCALIKAAAGLFDVYGYAGTSVSAIARAASMTSGAVYFHFGGKQQLALAVVEEHFAFWPPVIERVQVLPGTVLERVVLLSFEVARAFRDDVVVRAGSRIWLERMNADPAMPKPFVSWIEVVTGMLEQARREGSVGPAVRPEAAANVLVCAFFGTHQVSEALDGRRLIEDRVEELWLHLMPGLRPSVEPAVVLRRCRETERHRPT